MARPTTVDGRSDLRELEVQFRCPQRGLDRCRLRRRFLREGSAAIVFFARDGILALGGQPAGVRVCALNRRARVRARRGRSTSAWKGRGSMEEQVATADDGAFVEAHRGDIAGHARPDVDRVDRL